MKQKYAVYIFYPDVGWAEIWAGETSGPRQAALCAGFNLHPRKTIKINKIYRQGNEIWKIKMQTHQSTLGRLLQWIKRKIVNTPNILPALGRIS